MKIVLLVENSPTHAMSLIARIAPYHFHVVHATTLAAASSVVCHVDAVILDAYLPDSRTEENWRATAALWGAQIPLIVLTGDDNADADDLPGIRLLHKSSPDCLERLIEFLDDALAD